MDQELLRALADLFAGYDKAHGRYDIKRVNEKGKNEGRAVTVKGPPSLALWDAHVSGTGHGLGIIPLRSDDTVLWGCIDIDVIGIDHKDLEDKCRHLNLPLVICRSKSGGAHCFLFLAEPIPASVILLMLESFAARLGYGGAEVFPKQTTRLDEQNDIGNWLNMPYFYAERTNRYGVRAGEALDLPSFVAHAQAHRQTRAQLEAIEAPIPAADFEGGPPCLGHIASHGGFPDGTGNDGLYNVAVYLKKRFPDDWQNRLPNYNAALCDPPLPLAEVNTIVSSMAKKDYAYRCRKPPIAAHCNRRVCVGREFGVGDGLPPISLTKINGNPVLWLLEFAGKRIQMDTHQLTTQKLFQERVFETTQQYPPTLKQPDWEAWIGDAGRAAEVQDVDVDDTADGLFRKAFESWLYGRNRTTDRKEFAMSRSPYLHTREDGTEETWFRLDQLIPFLDTNRIDYGNVTRLGQRLRDLGCEAAQARLDGQNKHVWKYRDYDPPDDSDTPRNYVRRTEEF